MRLLRLGCRRFFGHLFLWLLFLNRHRHTSVAGIEHHLGDDLGDHLLQLLQKLTRLVLMLLDLTKFLLPNTRQLSTFEEVFVDEADELNARRRRLQAFAGFLM